MNWKYYNKEKPSVGEEVLAFNEDWIDEDFNLKGTRIGWLNDDNDFISAAWDNDQDCYVTISNFTIENDPMLIGEYGESVYPELWISLEDLINNLPHY